MNDSNLTAKLKALYMNLTGILSRREALIEMINESQVPKDKAALRERLERNKQQHAEQTTKLLEIICDRTLINVKICTTAETTTNLQ